MAKLTKAQRELLAEVGDSRSILTVDGRKSPAAKSLRERGLVNCRMRLEPDPIRHRVKEAWDCSITPAGRAALEHDHGKD